MPCLNAHWPSDWQSNQVGSKSEQFAQYPNPEEFSNNTSEFGSPFLSISNIFSENFYTISIKLQYWIPATHCVHPWPSFQLTQYLSHSKKLFTILLRHCFDTKSAKYGAWFASVASISTNEQSCTQSCLSGT